jgi:hypothetical protein
LLLKPATARGRAFAVGYLRHAGVPVDHLHLASIGIHGNGHMTMLEKNNLAIAAVMTQWLDRTALK